MKKQGVLLVNLGSPDSTLVPDVRRYLRQFLMDGRVLDAPWPIRFFIVNGLILPRRPKESAEAYRAIWTEEGSPLIASGRKVQAEMAKRLELPMEKVILTVQDHGNTSAASVPMALDVGVRDGRIQRGQLVLMEAFGGGFTWGSALMRY